MKKNLGFTKIRERWVCTLPKAVRKHLDIKIGDDISLTYENGKLLVQKVKVSHEDFKVKN